MVIRLLLAGFFSLIGLAGLILPILPGWLFFGVAALVLFPESRFANKTFEAVEKRWPRFGRIVRRLFAARPAGVPDRVE